VDRMSTRSTKLLIDRKRLSIHVYHEMHDGLFHMEIDDNKSHSHINVILPEHIALELVKVLKPLEVD